MNTNNTLFSIVKKDGREFVNLDHVVRLQSEGNCSWVFLQDGRSFLTTRNLGYYQKLLPKSKQKLQNSFFRIHHQHLINLSYISGYNSREKYIQLKPEIKLPVAQRRVKDFLSVLNCFSLY